RHGWSRGSPGGRTGGDGRSPAATGSAAPAACGRRTRATTRTRWPRPAGRCRWAVAWAAPSGGDAVVVLHRIAPRVQRERGRGDEGERGEEEHQERRLAHPRLRDQ